VNATPPNTVCVEFMSSENFTSKGKNSTEDIPAGKDVSKIDINTIEINFLNIFSAYIIL
jgi:hypothetical protein